MVFVFTNVPIYAHHNLYTSLPLSPRLYDGDAEREVDEVRCMLNSGKRMGDRLVDKSF